MGWNTTYNSAPMFVADWESIDRNTGRQIDWRYVPDSYVTGVTHTIVAAAGASQGAVTITVEALPVALPAGKVIKFGAGEFAQLTAPAAAGATSVSVEALQNAIESDDEAVYTVSQSNAKVLPAGTVMCQLSSGKIVPRADRPGSEEAIGLLISTAIETNHNDSLSGHGIIVGGVIFENLLPETITSYKTELADNGTGWSWQTYADSSEV